MFKECKQSDNIARHMLLCPGCFIAEHAKGQAGSDRGASGKFCFVRGAERKTIRMPGRVTDVPLAWEAGAPSRRPRTPRSARGEGCFEHFKGGRFVGYPASDADPPEPGAKKGRRNADGLRMTL